MSTSANDFMCPVCGKDDNVKKAPALRDSQTHTTKGTSKQTVVYVDKEGKEQSDTFDQPYSETQMSNLAKRLSPPIKPKEPSFWGWYLAALVLIVVGTVWIIISTSNNFDMSSEFIIWGILVPILVGALGVIIVVVALGKDTERKNHYQQVEMPRWNKAMDRWNQLYYCSRDDSVFVPSEKVGVPLSDMMRYIFEGVAVNP